MAASSSWLLKTADSLWHLISSASQTTHTTPREPKTFSLVDLTAAAIWWSSTQPPVKMIMFSGSWKPHSCGFGQRLRFSWWGIRAKIELVNHAVQSMSLLSKRRYEIRPPPDLFIGNPLRNGSWSGFFGAIQRGQADLSLTVSTGPERLTITDLVRTIEADTLVIISLKPQLLPQYLVIVRPFTACPACMSGDVPSEEWMPAGYDFVGPVEVWVYLIISIMLWGVALWLLERRRSDMTGEKSMSLDWSIFYGWAVMLDEAPSNTPRYISGQMLLGWWLVAVLVISTVYRSALVAFLSVQSKTKPIDSYQDLVSRPYWRWGIQDLLLSGQVRLLLANDRDPVIQRLFNYAEAPTLTEGLKKTLMGGYSLVAIKQIAQSAISLDFSDDFGQTPLYISRDNYHIVTDFGWALRKGAPYHRLFSNTLNRLVDSGLVHFWKKEVIASRVREARSKKKGNNNLEVLQNYDVQESLVNNEVVLGTRHLIGVYLVTLVGFGVSFLVLAGEKLVHAFYAEKDRELFCMTH
ncbi:glutamate receptor ionotropic, delta-1-like [Macrobrachium rosenbergii]|uniref:glutamate receptor ionotropic, delta-1-like n=1 Tax=Macrobrachium rosenbergii TaxID=79674 RepID=UPI0034D5C076